MILTRLRSVGGAVLLFGGIAILVVCWAVTNPIGAAPDEPSHYLKALGVASGDWLGAPVTRAQLQAVEGPQVNSILDAEPLVLALTRRVHIPYRLQPGSAGCTAFIAKPAICLKQQGPSWGHGSDGYTYLGTYQPFVYWPAGLAMSTTTGPFKAFVAGRLTFGLLSLLLIFAGYWLLSRLGNKPIVLLGILITLTPMVLFTVATVSASSLEISAGLATICAGLHLAYSGDRPRQAWAVVGLAGTVLALSRTLGPLWVFLIAALVCALMPRRSLVRVISSHRLLAAVVILLVAIASVVSVGWQLVVQPHAQLSTRVIFDGSIHGMESLGRVWHEEIGVFGWLDTSQTSASYLIWGALVWGLVILAWLRATTRERWTLGSLIVVNLALIPTVNGLVAVPAGGGVQGRWFLPFAVAVPLLSGVILARKGEYEPTPRGWIFVVTCTIAVVQFLALYQNARRYAVGPSGRLLFFATSLWSPPAGWKVWISLAAVGALMMISGVAIMLGPLRRRISDYAIDTERTASMTVA